MSRASGARLGVLVNPTAAGGRGADRGVQVLRSLAARGHRVLDLTRTDVHAACGAARDAVAGGLDALVVVGGDGTVNLGAGAVAGTGVPLAVVAAGTGNDLARAVGLPRGDLDAAIRALERALDRGGRAVDAARATSGPVDDGRHTPSPTGRWYLCVLSAGVDAAVSARAAGVGWPRGPGRYVRALAGELGSFRPYGYRVTLDDGVWESTGSLVAVANTPSFGGGMRIAPDARLDDGLLDVVLAGPLHRRTLVRLFPSIYRGGHLRHPAVQVRRSRTVLLEAHPCGPVPPVAFADGEPVGRLPLRVEVHPGALRLLA